MIRGMPQSIKRRSNLSKAFRKVALRPHRLFSGVKYRLRGWKVVPVKTLSDSVVRSLSAEDASFKNLSFTFAVIALSAKVACVDGALTQDKYIVFRDSFPLSGGVCGKIRSLFTLACHNETPLEHYVAQIKQMFPGNKGLYMALLERLFRLANAGGGVSRNAEKLLATIAHKLDITAADYEKVSGETQQARQIMGVDANVKANGLKKRYHELMRRYHPDRFAAQDLSPEVRMLLQLKSSEINEAYWALSRG